MVMKHAFHMKARFDATFRNRSNDTHTHTHTNTHTHTQIMESKTKESKGKQQYKDLEKLNRVIYYH